MHVMITVNAAWNVWNFRRPVVEALRENGCRVSVLAPPDHTVPQLEHLGCRFITLDMSPKGINPLSEMKLLASFRRIFREEKPDAVLSFTIKNNIFGAMAAGAIGIPFVPTVTGLGTVFLSGGLFQSMVERLYGHAFRRLPVVFFQNGDDRGFFVQRGLVSREQSHILPGSGIDLDHFAPVQMPSSGNSPVFLMIGRLLRDKGVFEFVEAARQVKASRPSVRFQLLGATNAENRTAINAATVLSWEDEGVIEYLGTTSDVRPFIAAADCVVLPSYREGAPRTLIEAAAMARPLIATDVPGCRSVVDDGRNGFLCAARSPESLAAAINRFLDLPAADRAGMGSEGRAKMEREFDQAIVVRAYCEALALTSQGVSTDAHSAHFRGHGFSRS